MMQVTVLFVLCVSDHVSYVVSNVLCVELVIINDFCGQGVSDDVTSGTAVVPLTQCASDLITRVTAAVLRVLSVTISPVQQSGCFFI